MNSEPARNILVTGSDGLIGWHFRVFMSTIENVNVIECNRAQFNDEAFLEQAVSDAHVVVHLAGMNRGEEDEIAKANPAIANRLAEACRKTDSRPHVIYSSSTHIDGDSKYGKSKRDAGDLLAAWADAEDARFCNLVLPHIFGEHGKPFYNSAASTFCHLVATGGEPEITNDSQLNLLHCQDAAQTTWNIIEEGTVGDVRPQGREIKVSELLEKLNNLADRYREGTVPNVDDPFDLQLFNTWRSYIPHDQRPVELTLHSDDRGDLFEAIRSDGKGQVFLSTTKPGITRGNHFHLEKIERFLVISGKARIRIRKVLTDEVVNFDVSGDTLEAIDIPTLHTHNITNTGDEPLITLFWAAQLFDPDNSDTYYVPVEVETAQAEAETKA